MGNERGFSSGILYLSVCTAQFDERSFQNQRKADSSGGTVTNCRRPRKPRLAAFDEER